MRGNPRRESLLKLVFHLKEPVISEEGIDIIIVPAAFSQYTTAERHETCSWLKPLVVATANDTRVLYFAYELELDGTSLWKQLINQGLSLFESIKRFKRRPMSVDSINNLRRIFSHSHDIKQTQRRPVLFICHSLGGVILKQALWIAHQDARSDTPSTLEDVVSGIVFLGSPHTTSTDDNRWENWKWIIKSTRRDIPKQPLSDSDIRSLAEVCQHFEELDLHIRVLSVFEANKSRVRDGLLMSIRSTSHQILVDQLLCQTRLKNEEIFEVNADHNSMWLIKVNSLFYNRLVKFFRSITQEAPADVSLLFNKPAFNDALTLYSEPVAHSSHNGMNTPSDSRQTDDANDLAVERPNSLPNLVDFDPPVRGGQIPVFMVSGRAQNYDFYGRQDILSQLDDTFFSMTGPECQPSNTRPRSYVICGIGGLGKTELATQYVFSRKGKFDAVFWVNADTREKLSFGFSEISRALGLEDQTAPKDDTESRAIVKNWLSKPLIATNQGTSRENDEASWLLVLDNVEDLDILYDFWPDTGTGCVIVTSRNPLSKDTVYSPSLTIDLAPFNLGEAGPFLQSVSKREYEENSLETCTKIADVLGGLPLAITQMGGIIRRRHMSLEEFLAYYEENARKLHEMPVPGQRQSYKQTVSSVWMLDALFKSATAILRVLSFLDPDRIQETILLRDTNGIELPDYPKSRSAYIDARTELLQSSLITKDFKNNELRIHRLVQDVVRERLTDEETLAVYESTIILLSNSWPFIEFDGRNEIVRLHQCEQLFPHVEKIRSLFERSLRSGKFKPSTASAALFNEVAWYMTERAHDETMGTYASIALAVLSNVPDKTFREDERLNRMLSQTHQYIAVSRIYTASPGALDHLKIMTNLIVERLQKWDNRNDALQLADSYNENAMALMRDPSNEDEAVSDWIRSYDAFGAIPDSNKIQQEWPAVHLALIYALRKEPSEWQKGEDILLPVLRAREEKFGKDATVSMVTGKVLHVLGDLRRSQGKLDEAVDLFQRALSIFRTTIGNNHYITADACYRLAEQLIRVGKKDEANRLLEQSLKIYGDIRWYKPQASRSAFMKGRLLKSMSNDVEGDAQLTKAIKLRKEVVPNDRRTWDQLDDEDFDKVVYYYSR